MVSDAQTAREAMSRAADGPPGGPHHCTGSVHGAIQAQVVVSRWGLALGYPGGSLGRAERGSFCNPVHVPVWGNLCTARALRLRLPLYFVPQCLAPPPFRDGNPREVWQIGYPLGHLSAWRFGLTRVALLQ